MTISVTKPHIFASGLEILFRECSQKFPSLQYHTIIAIAVGLSKLDLFSNIVEPHSLEWVSDCCLTPNEQFFSYIMARTSYLR